MAARGGFLRRPSILMEQESFLENRVPRFQIML
jgi:hypothetical protein